MGEYKVDKAFMARFVEKQLAVFIPDGYSFNGLIDISINNAIERVSLCVKSVKAWCKSDFSYLNSGQYAIFLYFLSNEIYSISGDVHAATKLFLLNKAINGIDLYYEVMMPEHFLIGHTVGMVFAKAKYGDYCVFHQGCTVGRQDGNRPVIGRGVVMYPDSSIIGRCRIGDNVVISAGTKVLNEDVLDDCIVFNGPNGLVTKKIDYFFAEKYFNCDK